MGTHTHTQYTVYSTHTYVWVEAARVLFKNRKTPKAAQVLLQKRDVCPNRLDLCTDPSSCSTPFDP